VPTIELTARLAATLKCPAGVNEITYWAKALPGFGVRCRASGVRTWFAMARLKGSGRTVKATFGTVGTVGFNEAPTAARDWLSAIKRGTDPHEEARKRRQAISLSKLIEAYLAHQQHAVKPGSLKELRRHLLVNARPLHRRLAVELDRRDIVELLQKLAERAPTQSNRTRSSLSAMFAWGMKAGYVPTNPIIATFKPSEERSRDRVLSDAELVWVWQCTESAGDYGRIVRLALLTGGRRSEISGMREGELLRHDDGGITWTLPAERSKNGLPHELILPPWIALCVPPRTKARHARHGDTSGLLFGEGAEGFNNWRKRKIWLDQRLKDAGHSMPKWVLHDLRRTLVTKLNDLGIEPHVIEALVNHTSGAARKGVAGVYNKSAYAPQKRTALVLWADHVRSLVEPQQEAGRVVTLKRAG
jgi:integrase